MLSSIHPLGERSKGNRFVVTAAAHVVGAAVGGALLGVLLGVLAEAIARVVGEPARIGILLVVVVAAAVLELVGRRPPSWRRQVNEVWLTTYRGWVYGSGFGLQLGAALVTIVSSPLTYVMVAAALLSGSFAAAFGIATTFGLARGLTLLAASRVRAPGDLVALHRALAGAGPRVARLASATMFISAIALGGVLAT
jgi:hypothetical protein